MPSQLRYPIDYATTGGWLDTWEILVLDGILAKVSPNTPGGSFSPQIDLFTFNFSIPTDATITGAIVTLHEIRDFDALGSGDETFYVYLGSFTNSKVQAVYYDDGAGNSGVFGGSNDTWGYGATLTPAVVNAPGFFVSWLAEMTGGKERSLGIDALSLEIFYSEPESVRPWPRVFSGPRLLR